MDQTIRILKPGLLTTVQDQGRSGCAHLAISQGGALDQGALALANVMVGNPEAAAGLEITGIGPTLYFAHETAIAWCGAALDAELSLTRQTRREPTGVLSLPSHRPIVVPAGSLVRWPVMRQGFRSWIACAGGIDAPDVLGSRSSHLAAGIGGTALLAGDQLMLGPDAQINTDKVKALILASGASQMNSSAPMLRASWSIPTQLPFGWPRLEIAVMTGRHFDALSLAAQNALFNQAFKVSPQSNRQGLQLAGLPISTDGLAEIRSEPVRAGTLQLPQSGLPVLLLAEHQTVGGYPRVLEALSPEVAALSQAGPGTEICFRRVSLAEAIAARDKNDHQRLALLAAIAAKFSSCR